MRQVELLYLIDGKSISIASAMELSHSLKLIDCFQRVRYHVLFAIVSLHIIAC